MLNYYLKLCVRVWYHMFSTSTLNKVYYQPDHIWIGFKTIRQLHKIMSIPEKDVKSWLAKTSTLVSS